MQRATRGTCACGCGKPLHGKHSRWYSESHRWKAWDKAHPRQHSLDFDSPSGWTPAEREQSAALRGRESKAQAILARLQHGPATTLELSWIGGVRFGARLLELRQRGYRIETEHRVDYAVYRLEAKP